MTQFYSLYSLMERKNPTSYANTLLETDYYKEWDNSKL